MVFSSSPCISALPIQNPAHNAAMQKNFKAVSRAIELSVDRSKARRIETTIFCSMVSEVRLLRDRHVGYFLDARRHQRWRSASDSLGRCWQTQQLTSLG